jgi:thiol:disulfide interchange protein DsbD
MRFLSSPARPRSHRAALTASVAPLALALVTMTVASTARADFGSDLKAMFEDALASESWALALGMVFLGGLLTSLTPCVYPMIAITVSVFGASTAKSKLHGAGLSTMYVLGTCALFTPMGLFAGLSGGVFGEQLANPWIVVPLAVLFLVLAVSMFGAFEMNLPPALQNRLAQMGGLGPKGAFVLGLVGGLIAAPCTGPVLSGLLIWIGTSGNAGFGAAALFVYALGLGLPTWLVGTFAISLPKSGQWLEWVKSVFGLVMIGAALWFVKDFIHLGELVERTSTWLGAGAVMLVVGLLLGAVHLSFHGAGKLGAARKGTGILLSVAGGMTLALWLNAAPVLPPGARIAWMSDYDAAQALARREGKPMLVDFGASWCAACEELDRLTFSDLRVVSEGQRFVPVRVDLSPGQDVARGRRLLANYAQRGLPLVVMHDSRGEEATRVTSFIEAEQMLQLMRDVD